MTAPVPGFPERFPVRRDDRRPLRYHVIATLCRAFFRTLLGRHLRIEGRANIPEGRVLVVCNHLSNFDPLLIGGFFPRTLFAMAKRELFPNRVAAWMWAGCNTFPVDRGAADRRSLRIALDICSMPTGRLLLFVEGTRAARPGMKRAEQGVGFLMRRTRISVLPVALWGSERALLRGHRLPRRVPITVRFGRAFTPDYDAIGTNQAAADLAAAHIAALLPDEYRGVYTEPAALIAAGAGAVALPG